MKGVQRGKGKDRERAGQGKGERRERKIRFLSNLGLFPLVVIILFTGQIMQMLLLLL